ncbi:SRPBCC family protein [Lyticum sinuosum]|nr:hypothetical protein [Lyticum sinuosum]
MWKNCEKTSSKIFNNIKHENIWNAWKDVNNWNKWDNNINISEIKDNFQKDAEITLTYNSQKTEKFILSEVDDRKSFTIKKSLIGAEVFKTYSIEEVQDGLKITMILSIKGILGCIWEKFIGENVFSSMQEEVERVVKFCSE